MDQGQVALTNEHVAAAIRKQAQRVQVKSLLTGAALAALAAALPV